MQNKQKNLNESAFINVFQEMVAVKVWDEMNFEVQIEPSLKEKSINSGHVLEIITELTDHQVVKYVTGPCNQGASIYALFQAWLLPIAGIDDFLMMEVYYEYDEKGNHNDFKITCQLNVSHFPHFIPAKKLANQQKFLKWLAIEERPNLLYFMQPQAITQTIATIAVLREPKLLKLVPETVQLSHAVMQEIQKNVHESRRQTNTYTSVWYLRYSLVEPELILLFEEYVLTAEIVELLVDDEPNRIAYAPESLISAETYREAVFKNPRLLPFVPTAFIDNQLVEYVIQQQPQLIFDVPKQFRTKQRWFQAITHKPELLDKAPKSIRKFMKRVKKILP